MGGKLLEMKGIVKSFPGVVALDHVDLEISGGEVLAIVGENGAGKSTLIKIMSGAYQQNQGQIYIDGKDVGKLSPRQALDYGITAIHQELTNVGGLSIAENIFLGNQPKKNKMIDYKTMFRESEKVQLQVGLEYLPSTTKMNRLSSAERQLVEIARAYAKNLRIIIMDEPTSALNQVETDKLMEIIQKLRREGKGIIYISHKLDEVFAISDRVQVLRNGKSVYTGKREETTRDAIITSMCGRELKDMYPVKKRPLGEVVLEVKGLGDQFLKNVSLNVRKGEIVGLYGLMGCGNSEIIESIFGARKFETGEIWVNGERKEIRSPRDAGKNSIAYIPADRKKEGLMLFHNVRTNLTIVTLKNYKKGIFLDLKKEAQGARSWIDKLQIKTPGLEAVVSNLSGGNQQKIVIAKWMANKPKIFLLNDPTKGIDVGAKVEIYKEIEALCTGGCGVLYVASELPELLGIADRVYVVHEGEVTGEFEGDEITQKNIIASAIGETEHG